jgi:hypothetical protein
VGKENTLQLQEKMLHRIQTILFVNKRGTQMYDKSKMLVQLYGLLVEWIEIHAIGIVYNGNEFPRCSSALEGATG